MKGLGTPPTINELSLLRGWAKEFEEELGFIASNKKTWE